MRKSIYTDEYRVLIDWLRARRKEKGITQRQLAELLDWDNCAVGRVETLQRRLDLIEFVEVCNVIGCNPQEGLLLVMGEGAEPGYMDS